MRFQQLQQANPAQYQQVTQQIANNLRSGAQSATAAKNMNLASQLTQLSGDFQSASQTGQLPNVQDLAKAVGGGHHHHQFGSAANLTSQSLQSADGSAANSQSALTIIDNTLSSGGLLTGQ